MGFIPLIAVLAVLQGCSREPTCVDLRPIDGIANHVQTFDVAIDVQRRRVYSSALGSSVVLAYDADTYEVLQDYPLGTSPLTTPVVEVDPDGNVWVVANTSPQVVRFEKASGDRLFLWDDVQGARAVVPRAAGGVVLLGRSESSNNVLVAYDASAALVALVELDPAARGLVPMDGFERVGVTLDGDELLVLDTEDLTEAARCPLAIVRPHRGAQLDDGTVVLASEDSIGVACAGEPQVWQVGRENIEVIALGDHALVLDRVGAEQGFDPNLGIGRLVDAEGVFAEYPTGKNTGFGVLDSQTGLVWVNSEGSSELLAIDPASGALAEAVRVGTFLDGLLIDPDDNDVVYATGRLSDTLVRIEDAVVTAETRAVHWPYAPTLESERDRLWVLSHTEGTLHALDRTSLDLLETIDPGLGSNTLLSFGNIMVHPGRGTLFFAESQQDLLLEIDPASGQELARWELGGPLISDPDEVGELAMRVDVDSGRVYLARSNDARLQSVDPDGAEVDTVFLPDDVARALSAGHRTDFMRLYPDQGLLFVGGKAVRLENLERWQERDLPVTRIAGPHPTKNDQWVAVDDARRHIVVVDSEGVELGRKVFARNELFATVFRVNPSERSVYMTRALHGNVCSFPVSSLR